MHPQEKHTAQQSPRANTIGNPTQDFNFANWRTNKRTLFILLGLLGGIVGAIFAENTPSFEFSNLGNADTAKIAQIASGICLTTIWSAINAAFITLGLFVAGEIYNRKPFSAATYLKALLSGLIAGAIAGFIAECIFTFRGHPSPVIFALIRSGCWGIMGGLLGWRISSAIPNMGCSRGILAGALGGTIGGMGFVIVGSILPEMLGRLTGIGIIGAALGLAVVIMDEIFRVAQLEVLWSPNERTTVSLGTNPVYIGGGKDQIFVAGQPEHALGIMFENGKIERINPSNGAKIELRDGTRIKVGKVEVTVHAKGAIPVHASPVRPTQPVRPATAPPAKPRPNDRIR